MLYLVGDLVLGGLQAEEGAISLPLQGTSSPPEVSAYI